jgi:hypothetical protein
MGHFSFLVANAVPWGRVSGPAGLAPVALQELECSCRGFFARPPACGAFISTGIGNVPAGLGAPHAHVWRRLRSVLPRRCSCASSPEPRPVRGDRGELSDLYLYAPSPSLRGQRVRFPQPPSIWSRIADSSSSCYRVIQVDAHAPFDKGWLVVRRLVHESACAGLLGGARSRSLGTVGAEALPRWDPPD